MQQSSTTIRLFSRAFILSIFGLFSICTVQGQQAKLALSQGALPSGKYKIEEMHSMGESSIIQAAQAMILQNYIGSEVMINDRLIRIMSEGSDGGDGIQYNQTGKAGSYTLSMPEQDKHLQSQISQSADHKRIEIRSESLNMVMNLRRM